MEYHLLLSRIYFVPEEPVTVKYSGIHVHGMVASLVREAEGEPIEGPNEPYRISPVMIKDNTPFIRGTLEKGKEYFFEISGMDVRVKQLLDYLLDHELYIGSTRVNVTTIEMRRHVLIPRSIQEVSMRFITPTFLSDKSSSWNYLLPDPLKVYGNLAKTLGVPDDKFSLLKNSIGIVRHEIHTCPPIVIGKGRVVVGFVGRCDFRINRNNAAPIFGLLSLAAPYLGVGRGRSYGFGTVAVLVLGNGNDGEKEKQ